jgi:glutathione S-transferase
MELTFSPTSPFMRKVMIIAHEIGIADKIKLVPINPRADTERLVLLNPLSKIPVLTTDKGEAIYDSPVICEYLDTEFGQNRFIPVGDRRWQVLTVAALADGILDAAILVRNERLRLAENQSAGWTDWQMKRVNTGLDRLEGLVDGLGDGVDLRHAAIASAIGYLILRMSDDGLLKSRPKLANWYKAIGQRPSFQKTEPKE